MIKWLGCLWCAMLVGQSDAASQRDDLPESVQQLIEQNSAVAKRIMELPYYLESKLTDTSQNDEVRITSFASWYAPSEKLFSMTSAKYVRTEAGLPDLAHLLDASCTLTHIDLNTKLQRGRREPGLVLMEDCDDPCVCRGMGFISYADKLSQHQRLVSLFILHYDREDYERYISLSEHFAKAAEIKYLGRDQMDGQWCAIIEVKFGQEINRYWLDEEKNGMVWCVDHGPLDQIYGRSKCTKVHEPFPGVFIPAEVCNYSESGYDHSAPIPTTLNNKFELVTISFSPEEWPNAAEKDFGFKFRPNSIIDDSREKPKHLFVIGKDINDVLFTFHRSEQFMRWCDERANQGAVSPPAPDANAQVAAEPIASSVGSGYLLPTVLVVIVVVAGGTLFYLRSLKG